jgi:streptomycin 6-kinase
MKRSRQLSQQTAVIPAAFAQAMEELFGEAGAGWLRQLPAQLAQIAQAWSLQLLPPFAGLSYNYVLPVIRDGGEPAVLKIGFPRPELRREIAALQLYDGRGMVGLLAADPDQGAMLLEHLQPGRMLVELPDDEAATRIAAQVMQQLWRPLPAGHPFEPVANWAQGLADLRCEFDGGSGPFPPNLVSLAEQLFAELLATAAPSMLLHGDLHHYNILSARRQPWLAIDPKGVCGEPAYEVGAWLHNPFDLLQRPQPDHLLARRVTIFSEMLGIETERLAGWGMAQAVLSAWWSYEDHGHSWEPALACAELLARLL